MDMKAEAIVFHGWGFDGSCWKAWEEPLSAAGIAMKTYDRGYYGWPATAAFSAGVAARIVITHSFGLHLRPAEIRDAADLLIVFSSFNTFHPDTVPAKRRSERLYRAMCDRFRNEPRSVLDAFFAQCDCPESARPQKTAHMDVDLLQEDLRDLAESVIPPAQPGIARTVLVFHGIEDRILPVAKGRDLASHFGPSAVCYEIGNAGHALPFTHANECIAHMEPFLREMGIG